MSNFTKPKGVRANGIPYGTQISAKADRDVTEDGDSRLSKTYAIHIRLDYPCPSPKSATTRMVGDKFVWERLYQIKGRGNAVVQATKWFLDLRQGGSVGKVLQGKEAYECVVVDDPWNECSYGSEFNPIRPVNRLLDEETKERVIEESKGNLKLADRPFQKGQSYPSLEWIKGAEKINSSPIKVGLNSLNPSRSMKDSIDNAVGRAKTRKENKQMTWLKEIETKYNSQLVNKMRKKGIIEHSSSYLERVKNKKRRKILANIAKTKNAQGAAKNENNTRGIGEYNRKVA